MPLDTGSFHPVTIEIDQKYIFSKFDNFRTKRHEVIVKIFLISFFFFFFFFAVGILNWHSTRQKRWNYLHTDQHFCLRSEQMCILSRIKVSILLLWQFSAFAYCVMKCLDIITYSAQSAGHFCREIRLPPPTSVQDTILDNLMVRFQSWSLRECRVPHHYHSFQLTVPVRVLHMGEIELFNRLLYW